MSSSIEKLRAREARIKLQIRELQCRQKSDDRKRRNARLIRWGIVVEAAMRTGEIDPKEWVSACKKYLTRPTDIEVAIAEIVTSLPNEAHVRVSTNVDTLCAPAAGQTSADGEG